MGEDLLRPGHAPSGPVEPEPEELRPPRTATWSALDAMLVVLLAFLLTFVATTVLMALVRPTSTAFLLSGLVFEVSLGGFSVLWVTMRRRASVRTLGLVSERPEVDFVVGVAGGAGLFVLTVLVVAPAVYAIVSLFTGGPVEVPRQEVLPPSPSQAQIVIAAFVVVVLAPLGEELFFRGLLFGALRRRFRFWAAAAISGVSFALFHVLPLLMPLMFFVGVGLAYLYERRGSLFAPIAAHAAFNLIGFSFIVRALT